MAVEYIDLHAQPESKDIADFAKRLGWSRVIKPTEVKDKNVQEVAKKLRKEAETIIASGSDDINRLASDCWEIDLIGSPEVHEEGDFMHQLNSGVDYVIAKACAEKGIAVEINFANVLNAYGRRRAQIMARMAQNVRICRDCECNVVITSGAKDKFGLRGPQELAAFGVDVPV
jgi:RNase P/RNase MRP subunit p30